MKRTWRTIAASLALSLAVLGLTACTGGDDCDDASGTSTVIVAEAAHFADGNGPGGKSKSKSSKPKKSKSKGKVHDSDDCEDDD
jgi:hypothetical protein